MKKVLNIKWQFYEKCAYLYMLEIMESFSEIKLKQFKRILYQKSCLKGKNNWECRIIPGGEI